MGSRNYIGRLRADNQVEFVYCHSGAYMEENGKILLEHYAKAEAVKSLIAGGAMSSLGADGVPFYDGNKKKCSATMPLAKFQAYEDIHIESLFLFDGMWHVKSGGNHIKGCDGKTWHKLEDVVKRLQMNVTERIKALDDPELKRLLDAFDSPLSGTGIGEGAAFELMAELESIAITEYRARGLADTGSSNPLGGLPDEQQAGYIP